jgi:hypothetical protein
VFPCPEILARIFHCPDTRAVWRQATGEGACRTRVREVQNIVPPNTGLIFVIELLELEKRSGE